MSVMKAGWTKGIYIFKHLLIIIIVILSAIFVTGCISPGAGTPPKEKIFIGADDSNIIYMGRVDFSNPKEPRFDWPGVSITAVFEGRYCGIALEDGNNDYNVFIDGELFTVISTKRTILQYENVSGLKNGTHTLLLTKRTEGYFGIGEFKGLYLEKGKKLLPPPETHDLNIEFIGDSITCGYGNEGESVTCASLREYQNNYLAYCAVASRELNANYSVIAISGRGVVRNYGEKTKTSEMPMPFYYDRVLQNDSKLIWDFSSWIPRIVVINLGTNDYSTKPHPDKEVFIEGYLNLIARVRTNYPDAEIFCLCGTMATPPQCKIIREVVETGNNSGDAKIHFVATPSFSQVECGCDWHPNTEAHKVIADKLVAEIRKFLN